MKRYSNSYLLSPASRAAELTAGRTLGASSSFEIACQSSPGYVPEASRFLIKWRRGPWKGEGLIEITPASTRMAELSVELSGPRGLLGRVLFSPSLLQQLAHSLGYSVRSVVEKRVGSAKAAVPHGARLDQPGIARHPAPGT